MLVARVICGGLFVDSGSGVLQQKGVSIDLLKSYGSEMSRPELAPGGVLVEDAEGEGLSCGGDLPA